MRRNRFINHKKFVVHTNRVLPDRPQNERPKQSFFRASGYSEKTHNGHDVDKGNINNHGVVEISLPIVMSHNFGNIAKHLWGKIHDDEC